MPLTHVIEETVEPTLNAAVFRRIRAEILSCRLMPNERLRMEALRERYSVGGSPIREALMRLEAEGLVELEQNKGFRVSPVSQEQLIDVMRMRREIEALALRWSIEKGDVEWEANLLGAFHRLSRQTKIDVHGNTIDPNWSREHRAFHAALAAASGSRTLLNIRDGLFDQAARYVALSVMWRAVRRNDIAEHEQIMQAALNRNVSRAVELNNEHIDSTTKKVLKSLTQRSRTPRLVSVGKAMR
jgi:GntR family carbon starvation induced transcriptional regulator